MEQAEDDIDQVQQATASSGLSTVTLGRTSITDFEVEVKYRGVASVIDASDGAVADLFMQEINFQPGGQTGWHQHPGPVVVLVTSGTLTFYNGVAPCVGEDYATGSSWVDRKGSWTHRVVNEQSTTAQIRVLYFLPGGAPARIDVPAPAGAELCP